MDQETVRSFIEQHGLHAPPAYRLLDLTAEVGELAADANDSTSYGEAPNEFNLSEDEIGDALFSLLALTDAVDLDADERLATSLEKYEKRLEDSDNPGSA